MAEAAVAWWDQLRAVEDVRASMNKEIQILNARIKSKDFAAGLGEAERAAELAKAKEERWRLVSKYADLNFEMLRKPDFSGMTEAERAVAAERLRSKELQRARRLQMEGNPLGKALEAFHRAYDFDPKQGGIYYNRFTLRDLTAFDLDEESPYGAMRHTDAIYKSETNYQRLLFGAVNLLSVKIACSDVGFPIHVFGTLIVRDSLDDRCVYHFRRDADHCQLVSSEAESLILTGPKRGLILCGDIYLETDLKIKDHLGQERELSKGLFVIRGLTARSMKGTAVDTDSLATRLSTVEVTYIVVDRALEGTIAVEVLQGAFHGKITAHTTSIQDLLVLYDSEEADVLTVGDCGDIELMRHVVSVHVEDMLLIVAQTSDGKSELIRFTPRFNGGDEDQITLGATKMRVKLFWSVMTPY